MKTGWTVVMTALRMPETWMPSNGFRDAAAEVGRKEGLEYYIVALTRTTAFAATSGNSSASMKYSKVELLSSTATACGGCGFGATSTEDAESEMTMCGGANCELQLGCCVMSK